MKGLKKLLNDKMLGYDPADAESIEQYAVQLENKTFLKWFRKRGFSRTTHIVKDKKSGKIRLLTAEELERIQGFPIGHTQYCDVNGEVVEMPTNKRRFMMGNALVVDLIKRMERELALIISKE